MKLYTITATPVRSLEQLTALERKNVNNNLTSLDEINKAHLSDYAEFVSGVLKGYGFDGFTIYQTSGYWQGNSEPSFKIELAAEPESVINDKLNIIETIAEELRAVYNQDATMVTYPDNSVVFIEE